MYPMTSSAETIAIRKPRAIGWERLPVWVRRGILAAVLVAAWHFYAVERGPLLIATPWQTAQAFWDGWRNGNLASQTWTTLRILLLGVGTGAVVAAVLTAFATLSKVGEDLLILLIGAQPAAGRGGAAAGDAALRPERDGAPFRDRQRNHLADRDRALDRLQDDEPDDRRGRPQHRALARMRVITDVLAPAALPHAISGLKTAWAFGWRTIIAAELVFGVAGSEGGLGNYINNARLYLLTDQMFAGLVTIALLGVVFEALFGALERRTIVRWGMKTS